MSETLAFTVGDIPVYGDLILAPLAGFSDPPYRWICRRMGSAMSYTEFVSAVGYLSGSQRAMDIVHFDPRERPVVFQVVGRDPDQIIEACLRLEEREPDVIDINMGCPSHRISHRGGGAGLLREPAKIARIFSELSRRLSRPVTGKIRLGWDQTSRNHTEIARILQDNGAALIAVHGRTRSQNYSTPADWDAIAEVKQAVDLPVLGNGDVRCARDIERLKAHTACDGVMIGRGAIGNPWIFQRRDWADVSLAERLGTVRDHLDRMIAFYGETRGVVAFRKHVVRYLHGIPGAARARSQLMTCKTRSEMLERLRPAGFLLPAQNVL